MAATRLEYLFERYLTKTYNDEEKQELSLLVLESGNDEKIQQLLEKAWQTLAPDKDMEEEKAELMLHAILSTAHATPVSANIQRKGNGRVSILWRRMAVAGAVLLAIGLGKYFLPDNKRSEKPVIASTNTINELPARSHNKPIITLANGKTIALDSLSKDTLAIQGNVNVVKLPNGQILYSGIAKEPVYNTLNNPRGSSVINMALADGSQVWLNAGSSITFPISFIGQERKVSVTGEAYFEIAHNTAMPFKVVKDGMEVRVLGTHFNVNSYEDEENMKVTLLQGSVKITKGAATNVLMPGQQAQVSNIIKVINDVNLESVMAWKNGKFQFGDKADITMIMREISRWYDLDIRYEGVVSGHIGGSISRNVNVSTVLKMLESTGTIQFKMEGNKVTVKPAL